MDIRENLSIKVYNAYNRKRNNQRSNICIKSLFNKQ